MTVSALGIERLSDLLAGSAHAHGERPAVVEAHRTVTYRDLEAHANRVAHLLVGLGVARGDRVGLYLDKSAQAIIAVFGVLQAGAAYVPLDPNAPVKRTAQIIGDCGIRCLLTGPEKRGDWATLVRAAPSVRSMVVLADTDTDADTDLAAPEPPVGIEMVWPDAVAAAPAAPPSEPRTNGDDLAYILYTSGSTGAPKGVMHSHGSGLAFVTWAAGTFGLTSRDRLSSHAPLHFDLSIFDLFAAVSVGAAIVPIPRQATMFPASLARLIAAERITVWYSVPSALSMVVLRGGLAQGDLPALRAVLFAGEVFPPRYLAELASRLPHVRLANLYGPTETNVCTWHDVARRSATESAEPLPIGKPIADTEVFVVSESGRLAATGETGELYVQGPTVMQGYWGDTERTDACLSFRPGAAEPRARVYRTGDFGFRDREGRLRLVGRRDDQVKTRGYRVELGDVEATLRAAPGVIDCAVLAMPDELVTNRIAAAVAGEAGLRIDALARFCRERLPAYMVPDRFELRTVLPKTSTGKTDRQRLARELIIPEAGHPQTPAGSQRK